MRLLRDVMTAARPSPEPKPLTLETLKELNALLDSALPPEFEMLRANRVVHAPGELHHGQRICDDLAKGQGDLYLGGIRIEESPLVPPNCVMLFAGQKLVGVIKKEDKT